LSSSDDTVVVAVFNSEFSWLAVVIWLVVRRNTGSEWKPLEESSNLWSFVMWVNWSGQMVVDTVIEGGELSGVWIVENVLSNSSIGTLVELVVLLVSDETSIGAIINFVSVLSKSGQMVEGFLSLSIVLKFIVSEVISPSDSVMELSSGVIVVPFHLWVILEESLELGQFHDTGFVWEGGGGKDEIVSE